MRLHFIHVVEQTLMKSSFYSLISPNIALFRALYPLLFTTHQDQLEYTELRIDPLINTNLHTYLIAAVRLHICVQVEPMHLPDAKYLRLNLRNPLTPLETKI